MQENTIIAIIGGKKSGKKTVADYLLKNCEIKSRTSLLCLEMAMIRNIFSLQDIGECPTEVKENIKFDPPVSIRKVQIKEIFREMRKTLPEISEFSPFAIPYSKYEMGAPDLVSLIECVEFKIIRSVWKNFFAESYLNFFNKYLFKFKGVHLIYDICYQNEFDVLKATFEDNLKVLKINGGQSYDGFRSMTDLDLIPTDFEIDKQPNVDLFFKNFESLIKKMRIVLKNKNTGNVNPNFLRKVFGKKGQPKKEETNNQNQI